MILCSRDISSDQLIEKVFGIFFLDTTRDKHKNEIATLHPPFHPVKFLKTFGVGFWGVLWSVLSRQENPAAESCVGAKRCHQSRPMPATTAWFLAEPWLGKRLRITVSNTPCSTYILCRVQKTNHHQHMEQTLL